MPTISPLTKLGRATPRVLPPITSGVSSWYDKDDEDLIVNQQDLLQGNVEYEVTRAQNITAASTSSPQFAPTDMRSAMSEAGRELQDDNVEKDPAWWQKVLGWMEPLKYLDIPVELGAEALLDPLAMATGRDLSWLRGTADRTPFEAWSAMFGGDVDPNKTGWSEFVARADVAAEAFEKRPLVAQLGLGAVQIAASMGAGSFAKGTQLAVRAGTKGAFAVAAARAARTGAMILDPWEVGYHGLKYTIKGGIKGAKQLLSFRRLTKGGSEGGESIALIEEEIFDNMRPDGSVPDEIKKKYPDFFDETGIYDPWGAMQQGVLGGRGMGVAYSDLPGVPQIYEDSEFPFDQVPGFAETHQFVAPPHTRPTVDAFKIWGTGADHFNLDSNRAVIGTVTDGSGPIGADGFFQTPEGLPDLHPIHKRGNAIRRLISRMYRETEQLNPNSDEAVDLWRRITALQMTLSMGARKGHTFSATAKSMWGGQARNTLEYADDPWGMADSGLLTYETLGSDNKIYDQILRPLDLGEAQTAADMYRQSLEAWSKRNADTINIYLTAKGAGETFDDANPLKWIGDEEQILAFNPKEFAENIRKGEAYAFETGEMFPGRPITEKEAARADDVLELSPRMEKIDDILMDALDPKRGWALADAEEFNFLPTDARLIRQQRATEMLFEGNTLADIMHQLRHGSTDVTTVYLRALPFLGEGSQYQELLDSLAPVTAALEETPAIQHRMAKWRNRQSGDKRVKGGMIGEVDRGLAVNIIGNRLLQLEQSRAWIDADFGQSAIARTLDEKFPEATTNLEVATGVEILREALRINVVARKSQTLEHAEVLASKLKKHVNHDYNPKAKGGNKASRAEFFDAIGANKGKWFDQKFKMDKPGVMNRAGYFVLDDYSLQSPFGKKLSQLGKVGDVVWAGDLSPENFAYWRKKRNKLREELAFDGLLDDPFFTTAARDSGVEGRWLDYFQNQRQIVEEFASKSDEALKIRGVGRTNVPLSQILADFADEESFALARQWDALPVAVKDEISQGMEFDIEGMFLRMSETRISGGAVTGNGPGKSKYWMSRAAVKKSVMRDMNKVIEHNNTIDGAWKQGRWVEDFDAQDAWTPFGAPEPEYIQPRLTEQDWNNMHLDVLPLRSKTEDGVSLAKWLGDPTIIGALSAVGIHGRMTQKQIHENLQTLATEMPRILGDSWAGYASKNPERAEKFIEILAARMANHKEMWSDISAIVDHDAINRVKRLAKLPDRRRNPMAVGITIDHRTEQLGGATTSEITAPLGTVKFTADSIATLDNIGESIGRLLGRPGRETVDAYGVPVMKHGWDFQDWINQDTALARILRVPAIITAQVIQGGGAGIASKITRGISARTHLYPRAEWAGFRVENAVGFRNAQNLEMERIPLTESQISQGVTESVNPSEDMRLEFSRILFEGLQKPADILKWETSEEAMRANLKWIDKEGHTGGIAHILKSASREGENWTQDSLTSMLLSNPWVVTERIRPEHLTKYFKEEVLFDSAGNPTEVMKSILFMMDMPHQTDINMWKTYGVDVVREVQKGKSINPEAIESVEYLDQYMPRSYHQNHIETPRPAKKGILQHNADSHFRSREVKDIGRVIQHALGHTDGVDPKKYALLPIAVALGRYTSQMHKLGIDKTTRDWLLEQTAVTGSREAVTNYRSENSARQKALRILEDKKAAGANYIDKEGDDLELIKQVFSEEQDMDFSFFDEGATMTDVQYDDMKKVLAEMDVELQGRKFNNTKVSKLYSDSTANSVLGDHDEWLNGALATIGERGQKEALRYLEVYGHRLQDLAAKPADFLKPTTDTIRYFKSGMDFGAPMIHLFNTAFRMPLGRKGVDFGSQKAFKTATYGMVDAFLHPDNAKRWQIENADLMEDLLTYTNMSLPEGLFGADNRSVGWFKSVVAKSKIPGIKNLPERFETAFPHVLMVARGELWRAETMVLESEIADVVSKLKAAGKSFDIDAIRHQKKHEMGAVINKMTGTYDPALVQQTPLQQMIESNLLFFAPMYRRATFGVLGDIFKGVTKGEFGIRQEQALRQLSGVLVAGALMGYLAEATGNNPRGFLFDEEGIQGKGEGALDITHRFGKFHIGDVQVGIGTAWWTAMRVAGDIAMNMAHDDKPMSDSEHWSDHWVLDMLGRRGRSQLAPGTAMVVDLFSGRNFIGEPLRDADENNYLEMGKHVGRSVVPFWLDGAFASGITNGGGAAMAAEFLGLQSYEISSWDKISAAREEAVVTSQLPDVVRWRKEQTRQGKRPNFLYMPKLLQNQLMDDNTKIHLLLQEHEENYGPMASGDAAIYRDWAADKRNFEFPGIQALADTARLVEMGQAGYATDLQEELTAYFKGNARASELRFIKYPEMAAYFADVRNARSDRESVFIGDIIYDKWNQLKHSDVFRDKTTGDYLWEKRERAEREFWSDPLNAQYKQYSIKRSDEWMRILPVVYRFEKAKDYLRAAGYFDPHNRLFPVGSRLHAKAVYYFKHESASQVQLRKSDPDFQKIQDMVAAERERLARNDSYLDRILVEFYGNNERHVSNSGLKRNLLEQKIGAVPTSPSGNNLEMSITGRVQLKS